MTSTVPARAMRILLVEDDDNHAMLAEMALDEQAIACEVNRVRDGVETLAFMRGDGPYAKRQLPDVVLLDLQLPKLNGHEVLAALKFDDRFQSIPVIVLTTSESDHDLRRAYRNHVNSYLVKPVDFDAFNRMIRDLKYYWSSWNRSLSAA